MSVFAQRSNSPSQIARCTFNRNHLQLATPLSTVEEIICSRRIGKGALHWFGPLLSEQKLLSFLLRSKTRSQWVMFGLLPPVSFSSGRPLEAIETWEHRQLRSLSSIPRSHVTSEAVWRPPWPQRPPKWLLEATCTGIPR